MLLLSVLRHMQRHRLKEMMIERNGDVEMKMRKYVWKIKDTVFLEGDCIYVFVSSIIILIFLIEFKAISLIKIHMLTLLFIS